MSPHFSQRLLHHFYHPHYVGILPDAPNVYRAEADIAQGDKVHLAVMIQQAVITQVRYQVYGCPALIACMSWLAKRLINQPHALLATLTAQAIRVELELPAHKFRCALLAENVLSKIDQQYRRGI